MIFEVSPEFVESVFDCGVVCEVVVDDFRGATSQFLHEFLWLFFVPPPDAFLVQETIFILIKRKVTVVSGDGGGKQGNYDKLDMFYNR